MSYSVESLEPAKVGPSTSQINQFDLPVKEFLAYDPKGTTTITGSPIVRNEPEPIATQPNTSEEQPAAAPQESIALSPKISALARKEAAQRQREQSLKQREQSLAQKLALAEKYEQLQAKLKAKDFSAAEELGLTYDEYAKYSLDRLNGERPEEQRYRKVEEEISNLKKEREEQINREYQVNQSLWKKEISKVVAENPDFITIKEWGKEAEDAVLQLINDTFDDDDIELSADQACKYVEEYLTEKAEKLASLTKVKSKYSTEKVLGPPKASTNSITQQMTTTPTKQASKPFHLMSESEQIAEAYRRVQAAKLQR